MTSNWIPLRPPGRAIVTRDYRQLSSAPNNNQLPEDHLELSVGDELILLESFNTKNNFILYRGYLVRSLASGALSTAPQRMGVFPATHIYIKSQAPADIARIGSIRLKGPPPSPPPIGSSDHVSKLASRVDALRMNGLNVITEAPPIVSPRAHSIRSLTPPPFSPKSPKSSLLSSPIHRTLSTSSNGSHADPIFVEISDSIKEWNTKSMEYLQSQKHDKYKRLKTCIDRLYMGRKRLTNASTQDLDSIKQELRVIIGDGRCCLADDVLSPSPALSEENCQNSLNVVKLYEQHLAASMEYTNGPPSVHDSSDGSLSRRKSLTPTSSASDHHIFFDLKACIASICGPGETTELFFSLYNKTESRFISEDYLIRLTYNGMPLDEDKIGKLYTVFADLSKRDMCGEVFLVCRIIRVGKMILSDKDMNNNHSSSQSEDKNAQTFRRPFGYSVLNITNVVQGIETPEAENGEFLMKIYTSSNEAQFSSLFENIIGKSGGYESSSRAEMVCIAVRLLQGQIQHLIKNDFGHLVNLSVTQRMGFPDVILPGDVRNSIYTTLMAGEFLQGRKTSAKNIEITLQVRSSTGRPISASIFVGTGEPQINTFESIIFYHNNSPKWQETVRLDIPIESFDRGTHVFLTFRHCSTSEKGDKADKSFAFAVLPLMRSDDTVIRDGSHIVNLFKYDKKHIQPDVYLQPLVFATIDQNVNFVDMDGLQHPISEKALTSVLVDSKLQLTKDTFVLKSTLCSTKLTQDVSLLNLLRWKSLALTDMRSVLKDFTFIGPLEIIKYLQDILDALFAILQHTQASSPSTSSDVPDLIFSAVVFVLNIILSDRRFVNFCPILEIYINNHFGRNDSVQLVWAPLLKSMHHLASNPKDAVMGKELRSSIKAWGYIFKVVSKSYMLFASHPLTSAKANGNVEIQIEIHGLLERIVDDIMLADASLIGTQMLVLQNIHQLLLAVSPMQLFSSSELMQFGIRILKSMEANNKKLAETKLNLCSHLIASNMSDDLESRSLISAACYNLTFDVFSREVKDAQMIDACMKVLLGLLSVVKSKSIGGHPLLSKWFPQVLHDLPILLDLYLDTCRGELALSEGVGSLLAQISTAIIATVEMATSEELKSLFKSHIGVDRKNNFLDNMFVVIKMWLTLDDSSALTSYPDSWISLHRLYFNTIMKLMTTTFHVMSLTFLNIGKQKFDARPWAQLMDTVVLLIKTVTYSNRQEGQKALIEEHPDLYQDIRPQGQILVSDIWRALSHYHSLFIPAFVAPFLQLTLCMGCDSLRNCAVDILSDMIKLDRQSRVSVTRTSSTEAPSKTRRGSTNLAGNVKNLSRVEIECIDKLDRLIVTEGQGDSEYREWLLNSLKSKIHSEDTAPFMNSLDKFLSLAFSVRSFNDDGVKKTSMGRIEDYALLLSHLLHFTALLDRRPIYIKYIHQLSNIQLSAGDVAEAGWALKLHADILEWDCHANVEPLDDDISLEELSGCLSAPDQNLKSLFSLISGSDIEATRTAQTMFARKEILYLIIICLFIKSQHYEHAIDLAEALAHEYGHTSFEYQKLSTMHNVLSELSIQLAVKERFYPSYYRVAFVGKGWYTGDVIDALLQGKDYIYRGQQWEKLGDFTERLLAKYPNSKVLQSNQWPASESDANSSERLLQIAMVKPQADKSRFPQLFSPKNRDLAPEMLMEWYENNDTNTFVLQRPFRKSKRDKTENEFLNLWTEEFQLTTEYDLPHFLRRSEVAKCERVEVAPIENAVRNIQLKNAELESLEKKFKPMLSQAVSFTTSANRRRISFAGFSSTHAAVAPTQSVNCNALTMSLNGAVDAPVNGGLPMYKKAFLESQEYLTKNPEHGPLCTRLRTVIDEQVQILSRCIELHGKIAPVEMRPLHAQIVEFFEKNFSVEIERLLRPVDHL